MYINALIGYLQAKQLIHDQLKALNTSYFDLYMLHSPIGNERLQYDTWRALEDLYYEGKGVSECNYVIIMYILVYVRCVIFNWSI